MKKPNHSYDAYHLAEFYKRKSAGRYNIPKIKRENCIPPRLIDFEQALNSKDYEAGVHFYIDDFRFERIWKSPNRYLPILKNFSCVCSPDFSLYRDMPMAIQIWNVYRSRLLGQIMQRAKIHVIPTVSWADKNTFSFCFSGIERGSDITISTVGISHSEKAQSFFYDGCRKICQLIQPKTILLYGKLPDFDFGQIKIIQYEYSRYDWKKQKNDIY